MKCSQEIYRRNRREIILVRGVIIEKSKASAPHYMSCSFGTSTGG